MAAQLIPEIGATGSFTAKSPFDSKINDKQTYQCMAVRRLSDLVALGDDPFVDYYQPIGLAESVYKADLAAGVCLVSLQSSSGRWIYIPNTYLLTYPGMSGVKYHCVVLGVALGAIPVNLDVSALKSQISNLVKDTLGVNNEIKVVVVSPEALVSQESHTYLEAARVAKITNKTTDSAKLAKAQSELATTRLKVTELETYIKTHSP